MSTGDPRDGVTHPMRSKEEAHDYRYFPDPDLLPLTFTQAFVDNIRDSLPELPDEKKVRFEAEYGISASNAGVLVAERENGEFFEALVHSTAEKSGKSERQVGQERHSRISREPGARAGAAPPRAGAVTRESPAAAMRCNLRRTAGGSPRNARAWI